jgi:hypothetical protein
MGDDTPFINFFDDQKFRASFYTFLNKVCHDCLTEDDRKKQLINLRKEIVTCADEKIISEAYLSMPSNDREILSDRMFTKRTKLENDKYFARMKEFNNAATFVLRYLSHEYFKDMKPGDWFQAYMHVAQVIQKTKLSAVVYKSKGEFSPAETLLPMVVSKREEILEVVYSGGNYDVDPQSLPPFSPELDSKVADNSPQHKRVAIYADEIDKIVDILWNRLRAITTDELYILDEFTPKDKYRCWVVDVALIWTILALNLEKPSDAERCIAEITGRALERSGIETSGNGRLEGLLSHARVLVDRNIESERSGETWFPNHMISTFSFVYDVSIENTPAKTEQRRALGYTAARLGPHIWPLFADVNNVLGDKISRKWLGESA